MIPWSPCLSYGQPQCTYAVSGGQNRNSSICVSTKPLTNRSQSDVYISRDREYECLGDCFETWKLPIDPNSNSSSNKFFVYGKHWWFWICPILIYSHAAYGKKATKLLNLAFENKSKYIRRYSNLAIFIYLVTKFSL